MTVKNTGRKKGVQNRVTRELKQLISQALSDLGGLDYLVRIGQEDPKAFLSLLKTLLPKAIEQRVKTDLNLRIVSEFDEVPPELDDDFA